MSSPIETIPLRQPARTRSTLVALTSAIPPEIEKNIEQLLVSAADPDAAVHYLVSLKQQQPAAFDQIVRWPEGLQYLITVFSYSRFLSEEILQNPQWVDELTAMNRVLSAADYKRQLGKFLKSQPEGTPLALSLALFRRQQILRILLRDVLGLCVLSETTEELSNLADAILDVSYKRIRSGTGRAAWRCLAMWTRMAQSHECGMSVIALGKLGGERAELQLRHRPDVRLRGQRRDRRRRIRFRTRNFTRRSPTSTPSCFPRTRPRACAIAWTCACGRTAAWAKSASRSKARRSYYQTRARDWELQMLIKARVAAGDPGAGPRAAAYGRTADLFHHARLLGGGSRVRHARAHQRKAQPAAAGQIRVRRQAGAGRHPRHRIPGAVPAAPAWRAGALGAARRHDAGAFAPQRQGSAFRRRISRGWISAYRFLRNLEHRLQFAEDRQTHTLPTAPRDLDLLARKMPSGAARQRPVRREAAARVERPSGSRAGNLRARHPRAAAHLLQPAARFRRRSGTRRRMIEPASSNLIRFLDERAPELGQEWFRGLQLRRGAGAFEHFLEKVVAEFALARAAELQRPRGRASRWTSSNTAPTSPKS